MGDEQLVGSSPEMFVRVDRDFVETCPISGTIARGKDAMEDSDQIRSLLNSIKDESELTMVTDVDRNDKSRICRPGTVQLKGRRLIETYSRLFHTVDHVTGTLREDCDSLDAFLSHMWAVTLTGAPKRAAMQKIEDLENSPREWYGGAIGFISFNGNLNTGITIRTIHLKDGVARVRVGATLLVDSDPDEEEKETRIKASAFIDAILGKKPPERAQYVPPRPKGRPPKILFVDHQDSFVHTLANYVRQTGAQVITLRAGFPFEVLEKEKWDMIFLSPGPGRPSDFGVADLVKACVERGLPVFGVCLGLQGMVEAFGGKLSLLDYPMHGKPSMIRNNRKGIFEGFPGTFKAGRYHSIYAKMEDLPSCLERTAVSDDQVVMGVTHKELPMAAVQFHPESILTLKEDLGLKLLTNVVRLLGHKVSI
jgi:anthranilate synthase